ncbi:RHS repeat domain-containing protein [Marinobacter bohaiensis]|uniref:RHS repeat domain-containing protein n=1 Tax=Marinobacter bohaiensis TaxID=2201898 RepID=UPI002AF6C959|nr:RHS repeat-associated core domain-containing protein [Marinobacter bohaiensis]
MKTLRIQLVMLAALMLPSFGQSAQMYFIHSDQLGSPVATTDENQAVIWKQERLPFGSSVEPEVSASAARLGFPGQYLDRETGYRYNYHRDYDPNTGRYIESDPIGLAGGDNTYVYALSNPLRLKDLFGLDVYGINVGLSGVYGVKGSYSIQILLDTRGNFGVQRTREIGAGLGAAGGAFANLVYGFPNDIYDLENYGISASGSAWFVGGAVNGPISTEYEEDSCEQLEYFSASIQSGVLEGGLALSVGSPEVGITGTYTDTLYSNSILGDIGRWLGKATFDLLN